MTQRMSNTRSPWMGDNSLLPPSFVSWWIANSARVLREKEKHFQNCEQQHSSRNVPITTRPMQLARMRLVIKQIKLLYRFVTITYAEIIWAKSSLVCSVATWQPSNSVWTFSDSNTIPKRMRMRIPRKWSLLFRKRLSISVGSQTEGKQTAETIRPYIR